jgi:xanthine dehydrogenase YagS FAD-binding subunit
MLKGRPAARENFQQVADFILRDARGYGHNNFKIELARRAIPRALRQAAAGTPQPVAEKRIL